MKKYEIPTNGRYERRTILIFFSILGVLSEDQKQEFQEWLAADPSNQQLYDDIKANPPTREQLEARRNMDASGAYKKVMQGIKALKARGESESQWIDED